MPEPIQQTETIESSGEADRSARILEMSLDAIISVNESGRIVFWNSASQRLYGYTKEEASLLDLTSLMPESYRAKHKEGFDRFLKTGKAVIIGHTVEVECLKKDGTAFPVELSLSSEKNNGGWIFTAVIRDITERKGAQEREHTQNAAITKANSELTALYKVSSAISGALDLTEILPAILHTVTELDAFKVERKGGIFLVEDGRMDLAAHLGHSDSFLEMHKGMRVGQCLCGISAMTGELLVSTDSSTDERHTIRYDSMPSHGHVIVPIKDKDGVIGVMYLYTAPDERIDDSTRRLLSSIGEQLGIAIRKSLLYERTKELSLSDHLTGSGNKRMLDIEMDRLFARAKRYSRPFSCMMLDIDRFKLYNDSHGHLAGDIILREVANEIRGSIRETDLVARYGGEEFMVMLPETLLEKAALVAEKIRLSVEKTLPVTVSIGVCAFSKEMTGPGDMIAAADRLLYSAKEHGRNRVETEQV